MLHCSDIFSVAILKRLLILSALQNLLLIHKSPTLYFFSSGLPSCRITCAGQQVISLIDPAAHI